eukprot:GILI01001622.1.p1 GENE.GILI01001622.1~~GILI01001622.1.p1  ORF type:complete len:366 (+),score=38.92 GILI01001622.1:47-1144(+)
MQAPQEQKTKCPICKAPFDTIKAFVLHLSISFEQRPCDETSSSSSDGSLNGKTVTSQNYTTKVAECCEAALAHDYASWDCIECHAQGGISHLLHEALSRCPVPPTCNEKSFPDLETIPNLNPFNIKVTDMLVPPHALGPYTLISELSKGASSKVFVALSSNAEPVALKVPLSKRLQSNEIEMLKAVITIPHTAELISFEKFHVASPPIEKEYVFGIAQRLYAGDLRRFPKDFLSAIMKDVAVSLLALWRSRICHLDVKPANIFWRRTSPSSFEAVLGDFGSATQFQREMLISSASQIGTPDYYPPEKTELNRKSHIDARGWDAYALGKSLKELGCDDEEVLLSQNRLLHTTPQIRITEIERLASA